MLTPEVIARVVERIDYRRMRLAVFAPSDFAPLERLRDVPDVEVVKAVRDADAILLAPRFGSVLVDHWQEVGDVRWIHTLAAGVETLPFDLLRSRDVVVTNSRGLYADALGEFVIAAMLWFAKDLRRLVAQQDAREWAPFTVERLEGKTLAIIGYGSIGEAIGRRAAALGMQLLTIRRRLEFGEPTIDDVIAEADFVALSLPLTPSTRGILSAARIEKMRTNAVLINVSRGAVVDEAALVAALAEKRIRGRRSTSSRPNRCLPITRCGRWTTSCSRRTAPITPRTRTIGP